MNRQTSIALHLARVMGKPSHEIVKASNGEQYVAITRGWSQYGFRPHYSRDDWAECVLWAAGNGLEPLIMRTTASAWSDAEMKEISVDSAGDIQAATLEAIARATGWEESK